MFDQWIALKKARKSRRIEYEISSEGKFQKIYGPRADFGKVLITARPASEFSYESKAEWDSDDDNYDDIVLEGILDELLTRGLAPIPILASFTLEQIWWHPVDGSPNAFYFAARDAVASILKEETRQRVEEIKNG